MKRFVGPTLVVLALSLGLVWAAIFPESEPELGAAALLVILEIAGIGIALGVSASDTRHLESGTRIWVPMGKQFETLCGA
jgi:hypothetical protein